MPVAALVILFFLGMFAVLGFALAAASAWLERKSGGQTNAPSVHPDAAAVSPLLKTEVLSTISVWAYLLSKFAFVGKLKILLAEADLDWSVGRTTLLMLVSGGVALAVFLKIPFLPGWAGAAGAAGVAWLPYLYVRHRRHKRMEAMEEQLPDALDFLARSLRAGHPFSTALEMLSNERMSPLAAEIRKAVDERRLGLSWETAFENLCRRVPLQEMSVFAAAVQLQSRTGGKLSEVLVKIAENMREASALRGEVRSISAHGRLTGLILTLLPVFIVIVMSIVNPYYLGILVAHPHGKDLIAAAIGCLILAHLIIRRMVAIRV
jgi:tight adherence protein B